MAMVRVEPVEVRVRAESAAFPVVTGPRTLFEVETADARLQLSFRHRSRRWTVEGMESLLAA
jgi:hypothetical protein